MRRRTMISLAPMLALVAACRAPSTPAAHLTVAPGATVSPGEAPAPASPMRAAAASPSSSFGSRGSTAVGAFVRAHDAQLQFCYAEARARDAALAGTATIGVTLAEDGAVRDAGVVKRAWSGGDGEDVEQCVLRTVRRWRFPKAESGGSLAHSFTVVFTR